MRYLLFNILAVGAFYILFSGPGSVSENADKIVRNLTEKVGTAEINLKELTGTAKNTAKSSFKSDDKLPKEGKAKAEVGPPKDQFENLADRVIREELANRAVEKKAAYIKSMQQKTVDKKPVKKAIWVSQRIPKTPVTVRRDEPSAKSISAPSDDSYQTQSEDWQKPISEPQFLSQDLAPTQVKAQNEAQVKSEPKPSSPEIALSEGTNLMSAKDRRRQLHQLVQQMELVFLDRSGE